MAPLVTSLAVRPGKTDRLGRQGTELSVQNTAGDNTYSCNNFASSPRSNQLQNTRFKSGTPAPAQLLALATVTRNIALQKASLFLENIPLHTFASSF